MINYQLSFLIAVLAYVYTNILTDVDMIFNGLYNWLDQKIVNQRWIFHIIIHCEKCIGGQLAFWIFSFIYHNAYLKHPFYTALIHIFFITFTILTTEFIKQTHKLIKND